MATYYTLQVFDSEKYFSCVLPQMKNDEEYLNSYLETEAFKLFTYRDKSKKLVPNEFQEFLKNLSFDGKSFNGDFGSISYGYYKLIEIIIFSECALFTPYFHLGYMLLSKLVQFTKRNTIAEELINKLKWCGDDSVFGYDPFGIYNWLTKEEVELLFLDLDKIISQGDDEEYCKELKIMITEAFNDNLGLICCRDPHFEYHCYVNNNSPNLQRFKKNTNLKSLVEIDCSRMRTPLNLKN